MIKSNDLRIGNWIYMPNNEIGKVGYEVIRALIVLPEKPNYKPIPLTEDILLKSGYPKLVSHLDQDLPLAYHKLNSNIFLLHWISRKDIVKNTFIIQIGKLALDCSELDYVNQLQNLYFALTGEELICKLK